MTEVTTTYVESIIPHDLEAPRGFAINVRDVMLVKQLLHSGSHWFRFYDVITGTSEEGFSWRTTDPIRVEEHSVRDIPDGDLPYTGVDIYLSTSRLPLEYREVLYLKSDLREERVPCEVAMTSGGISIHVSNMGFLRSVMDILGDYDFYVTKVDANV